MAKVLKLTKSDKTIHVVNIADKAFFQHMNARILSPSEQIRLEEIDESEANGLPFFDETYVTAKEAQSKVPEMQKRIEELERQLKNTSPEKSSIIETPSEVHEATRKRGRPPIESIKNQNETD